MNRRIKRFIHHGFMLCCLIQPSSGFGENNAPFTDQIRDYVEHRWAEQSSEANDRNETVISGLPAGYAPPACDGSVTFTPAQPLKPGRNSILVRCSSLPAWSIMAMADIRIWRPIVVLRENLHRDQSIGPEHLILQERNIALLQRGFFTDINDIRGNVSKRSLKAGAIVSPDMIRPPLIIERGQQVVIEVNKPGIQVRMKAVALRDGRAGDRIRVRNLSSERVLYATVVSADLVTVD